MYRKYRNKRVICNGIKYDSKKEAKRGIELKLMEKAGKISNLELQVPYLLIDTVGALTDNSLSWNSNGIDYYLVSEVLSQNELIDIARSVSAIPVMK